MRLMLFTFYSCDWCYFLRECQYLLSFFDLQFAMDWGLGLIHWSLVNDCHLFTRLVWSSTLHQIREYPSINMKRLSLLQMMKELNLELTVFLNFWGFYFSLFSTRLVNILARSKDAMKLKNSSRNCFHYFFVKRNGFSRPKLLNLKI